MFFSGLEFTLSWYSGAQNLSLVLVLDFDTRKGLDQKEQKVDRQR